MLYICVSQPWPGSWPRPWTWHPQVKGAFMESLVDMDVEALKDAWARRQASAGDGANAAAAAQPAAAQQPQQQQPQQQQPAAQVRLAVLSPA